MAELHTVAECTKKLVVLLNKVTDLQPNDPMLGHKVEDCKQLARELKNESEFVSGIR